MPKVSVVVPIYKVEKYLKRCVESIRKQTLEDIEIILVDDGSPDACPQICDEYSMLDSRIKVVHKKNGGLSSARNAGMEVATGKYIGFADSDDYVEIDAYEKMYLCAEENQVDFVMSDYWRISKNGEKKEKTLDIRSGRYTKDDIKRELFPILIMRENVDYGPLLSVWHCLYRSDFVMKNKLFFDNDVKWSEDCIYSAILGYKANSFFYYKHQCIYNYCENEGSISRSFRRESWDVYCLMNERLHQFFDSKTDFDFSRQLDLHMLYFACSVFNELKYSNYSFAEKYRLRKKVLSDKHLRRIWKNFTMPNVSIKFKIIILLMKNRFAGLLTIIGGVSK